VTLPLQPIGVLRTPWQTIADCPRNGRQPDPPPLCHAEIDETFRPGLQAIEGFSHLILLYWLGDAPRDRLQFTPPFDTGQRGVFATRAPWRPNPIGLSVVKLEGIPSPGHLAVRHLDCLNGTILLDVKPYLPTTDSEPAATMGWLAPHATMRGADAREGSK
jgi:tRNA-Thr(GGU) m(6)t(6)A37 methyltransferase TsaA